MPEKVRAAAPRLRAVAEAEGWSIDRLAREIETVCQVSPLASYRHAIGFTLVQAAERLNALRPADDTASTTMQQLSQWELGGNTPKAAAMNLLTDLYGASAERLGLVAASSRNTMPGASVPTLVGRVTPGNVRTTATPHGGGIEGIMDELEDLRRNLGETLSREHSESELAFLERRVNNYDAASRVGTSAAVVLDIGRDLQYARQLLDNAHSPDSTGRLLTVIARLSGMLGIMLTHLGDSRLADQWFLTATMAAEKTDNRGLRAWVVARTALIPLYYGNPHDALRLADQSLALAGTRPTADGLRALSIKARILSSMPAQRRSALTAAERMQEWYESLSGSDVTDGLLGVRPVQLAGYLGEVYTRAGDSRRAIEQHNFVLGLYNDAEPTPEGCLMPEGCLDYGLTSFSAATNLISEGEYEHGATTATVALQRIPAVCCTPMVLQEARRVAMAIPERARSSTSWQELRDTLAFRKTP